MSRNVVYPFVLNPTGGSFFSTKLLIENLDRDFDCRFVFGVDGSAAKTAREEGIPTTMLELGDRLYNRVTANKSVLGEVALGARLLPYIQNCREYLLSESIDIVHVNDGLAAIIWGIAARMAGIPVIWQVRSQQPNAWDPIRLRLSDHVILVAETNKVRFGWDSLAGKRASIVPNGVDINEFSPGRSRALHYELEIPEESHVVGFVGNLVARKRPLLFVNSALHVLSERKDIHFVLVGEDKDEFSSTIREKARNHGVGSNIHLLGFRSDISSIMKSLDILMFTSRAGGEAFPRVPLEAMACGTPVLTTDSAGVTEAVVDGETGRVVNCDIGPDELGSVLLAMLSERKRLQDWSTNGAEQVRSKFRDDMCAVEVQRIYSELTKEGE